MEVSSTSPSKSPRSTSKGEHERERCGENPGLQRLAPSANNEDPVAVTNYFEVVGARRYPSILEGIWSHQFDFRLKNINLRYQRNVATLLADVLRKLSRGVMRTYPQGVKEVGFVLRDVTTKAEHFVFLHSISTNVTPQRLDKMARDFVNDVFTNASSHILCFTVNVMRQ